MTPDPFQVIEEALRSLPQKQPRTGWNVGSDPAAALAALASLREERERQRVILLRHQTCENRILKAEAERDELRELNRQLTGRNQFLSTEQVRADAAESLAQQIRNRAERAEAERDHYRFHFDQQEQRAAKAEAERDALASRLRALGYNVTEILMHTGVEDGD